MVEAAPKLSVHLISRLLLAAGACTLVGSLIAPGTGTMVPKPGFDIWHNILFTLLPDSLRQVEKEPVNLIFTLPIAGVAISAILQIAFAFYSPANWHKTSNRVLVVTYLLLCLPVPFFCWIIWIGNPGSEASSISLFAPLLFGLSVLLTVTGLILPHVSKVELT